MEKPDLCVSELGQSTILFLFPEFVSWSSPQCFVGYHVHPICDLSQAPHSSVSLSAAAGEQWPTNGEKQIGPKGLVGGEHFFPK